MGKAPLVALKNSRRLFFIFWRIGVMHTLTLCQFIWFSPNRCMRIALSYGDFAIDWYFYLVFGCYCTGINNNIFFLFLFCQLIRSFLETNYDMLISLDAK